MHGETFAGVPTHIASIRRSALVIGLGALACPRHSTFQGRGDIAKPMINGQPTYGFLLFF